MITVLSWAPISLEGNRAQVDRKFHTGMLYYVEHLPQPITVVTPTWEGGKFMDAIEIPIAQLPYEVMTVDSDSNKLRVKPHELQRLRGLIARSALVYGRGLSAPSIARELGVPYIPIVEFDLDIELKWIAAEVPNVIRRIVRSLRFAREYARVTIPDMRHAHSLHCNGYPIYHASRKRNANRLLYFDSRMSAEQVISADALEERLSGLGKRPLRLVYSGRYERIKGADDAVRVARECLRRGLPVELHCYGKGSLRDEMGRLAQSFPAIHIHDAVPYPTLVKIVQSMDLFVCCHIQSDPSCTYIESMGAGLPVVGYGNRMWRPLSIASGTGLCVPIGKIKAMADAIESLMANPEMLRMFSRNARTFALEHSFEKEFDKRVSALRAVLA